MAVTYSKDVRDPMSANGIVAKMVCQSGTETIDPTSADVGLPMPCVNAITVALTATGGTLNGGFLRAWIYHTYLAQWMRAPVMDLSVDGTGLASQVFPTATVTIVRYGQLVYLPDGLGDSLVPTITIVGSVGGILK